MLNLEMPTEIAAVTVHKSGKFYPLAVPVSLLSASSWRFNAAWPFDVLLLPLDSETPSHTSRIRTYEAPVYDDPPHLHLQSIVHRCDNKNGLSISDVGGGCARSQSAYRSPGNKSNEGSYGGS